ncbi:TauD/TfdA family dioxygenase [Vibrio hyugaensis]|uniref:TauD/TfdA family dioxygenase n=1 Tax=Vibrio hyugaensis TaxID=1534743 RepID=UPI0005EFD0E5|nr:TauD/TfdA family dioxygenase [Vibrio hyugaensis]
MYTEICTDEAKNALYSLIEREVKTNPYKNYDGFLVDVKRVADELPEQTSSIFKTIRNSIDNDKEQVFLIRNCPIDKDLPELGNEDPVNVKRATKKTFVGEALLALYSICCDMPILSYTTRNEGDFFQDVKAMDKYNLTQTQKTNGALNWHNDRTAHPVRADYLMLLGLRVPEQNRIETHYIDAKKVISQLPNHHIYELNRNSFYTPYDDFSRDSNANQQNSEPHSIIYEGDKLRYYDDRTNILNPSFEKSKEALENLKKVINESQVDIKEIQESDLFIFPNLKGLHARQLAEVQDFAAQSERWLLKTYNFESSRVANRYSYLYTEKFGQVNDDCLTV